MSAIVSKVEPFRRLATASLTIAAVHWRALSSVRSPTVPVLTVGVLSFVDETIRGGFDSYMRQSAIETVFFTDMGTAGDSAFHP
jgi:hypothetical protein